MRPTRCDACAPCVASLGVPWKPLLRRLGRMLHVATWTPARIGMRFYETDKYEHGYPAYYGHHFARVRFRRLRILEIGVGGYARRSIGGSLRFWRDYFPRSRIVGLDINEKDVHLGRRVAFVAGDQSSPDALARACALLGGAPHIVIDDGSHVGADIHASFRHLFPILPVDATYVIEDLHTSFSGQFGGSVPAHEGTAIGLLAEAVVQVQVGDQTFARHPELGCGPAEWPMRRIASLHAYPGVAFLIRGSESPEPHAAT